MLADTNAVANLAVRDLDVARRCHEGTLGMPPVDREGDDVAAYGGGDLRVAWFKDPDGNIPNVVNG